MKYHNLLPVEFSHGGIRIISVVEEMSLLITRRTNSWQFKHYSNCL